MTKYRYYLNFQNRIFVIIRKFTCQRNYIDCYYCNIIIRNRNIYPAPIQRIVLTRVSQRSSSVGQLAVPKTKSPLPTLVLQSCEVGITNRWFRFSACRVGSSAMHYEYLFLWSSKSKVWSRTSCHQIKYFQYISWSKNADRNKIIIIDQLFTQAV